MGYNENPDISYVTRWKIRRNNSVPENSSWQVLGRRKRFLFYYYHTQNIFVTISAQIKHKKKKNPTCYCLMTVETTLRFRFFINYILDKVLNCSTFCNFLDMHFLFELFLFWEKTISWLEGPSIFHDTFVYISVRVIINICKLY